MFGLDVKYEEAKMILLPVPWEVTTSYGDGASRGPELILQASEQVDLYDLETQNAYKNGYYMLDIDKGWLDKNDHLCKNKKNISEINEVADQLNKWVYDETQKHLKQNKYVGVVGGDHSVPLGAIKALSEKHSDYGIVHIDAHHDFRNAYQGFKNSHASIMYNVMQLPNPPKKLIQLGIRDFCEEEFEFANSNSAVQTFYDVQTKKLQFKEDFKSIIYDSLKALPEKVYISFDIDGLDPTLCPGTGTPVPGGLTFNEALTVFSTLHELKKQIIGFDLVEVAGKDQWNGNVGARVLFKLCGWTMLTNGEAL